TGSTTLAGELLMGSAGAWVIDKDVPAFWVAIDRGTLQIGDGGTSGSLVGTSTIFIFPGGTLRFDRSDDVVSDMELIASSALATMVKAGAGTLTLTNIRTNLASVVIEDGTLRFSIAESAVPRPSLRVGAISNNGTLVVDSDLPLSTYASVSGSGSLIKDGSGVLEMFTPATYTGVTRINHGTLLPVSLAGDAIVGTEGSLGGWYDLIGGYIGMGSIGGDVANDGRTVIAAGDGHVVGDYTQSASGTLSIALGGKLVVDGGASLAGPLGGDGEVRAVVASAH